MSFASISYQERRATLALLLFLFTSALVAALGSIVTIANVTSWYHQLVRPSWTPPDGVFGPVWSILYLLMAIAGWMVWRVPRDCIHNRSRRRGLQFYALQLVLNALWSPLFFQLHLISLAAVDIVALLFTLAVTIWWFRKAAPATALLMLPYFGWVLYAASLNMAILWLNPG